MGSLDNVVRSAVPGGSIAKPLMIALVGLLASGVLFKKSSGDQSTAVTPPQAPADEGAGGVVGGLGGLVETFSKEWTWRRAEFMDRHGAKSAGIARSARHCTRTRYHKGSRSAIRLIGGRAHLAVVKSSAGGRRQADS